jgi:FkbM family methyltransferase
MTNISSVENCRINFTPTTTYENCEIKLVSGYLNEIFYSTKFDKYEKNIRYWIYHPRLLIESEVKMFIYEKNILLEEIKISENQLVKNDKHIFNVLPEVKGSKFIDYINESYVEIFIDGNFGVETKCPYIFENVSNFIDLGGNCGFFSKYIFNRNPESKGILIEPNSKLKDIISSLNKGYNLITEFKALNKNKNEKINFKFTESLLNTAVSHESNIDFGFDYLNYQNLEVNSITLEEIIEQFEPNELIDIMKVDIEGGEKYLLTDTNLKILRDRVKYLLMEVHGSELYLNFKNKLSEFEFEPLNDQKNNDSYILVYRNTKLTEKKTFKKILVRIKADGMGDVLCSTPTIRKISESYSQKIDVMTKRADVYKKNPYVSNILNYHTDEIKGYDEVFETFHFTMKFNKPNVKNEFSEVPIEVKLCNFEARQMHALGVGLTLYPEEMHYDFIPDDETERSKLIDKNTLVLHVTESWPSRTWTQNKWQKLVNLIKEKTNFKVCVIGRSHVENGFFGLINKNIIHLENVDFDFTYNNENLSQIDNNRESLSEMWHVLNNSYGLISFDSGPIHLAGVTDSWIFQIGSSVRYEKTAPYRNQSQNYKFYFIGGECKLMCASNPKYAVKEWGSINTNHYYPKCQEGYTEFKCHPTPEMILDKIIESNNI